MILLAVTAQVAAQESYVIDSVCIGAERYYRINGEEGSTYFWVLTDDQGNEVTLANPDGTLFTGTDPVTGASIQGSEITISWPTPGDFSLMTIQTSIYGCDSIQQEDIRVYDQPEIYAGDPQIICPGNTVELFEADGNNYSTLLWTSSGDGAFDDETALNPTYTPGPGDISAGEVILTITAEGLGAGETCTPAVSDVAITIIELTAELDSTNITCFEANDGIIRVINATGGSGQYQYRIDGGEWQTETEFANLGPGSYTVEMSDLDLPTCIAPLGDKLILEPLPLTAVVDSTNTTCLGDDGTITVSNPQGGSGSFGSPGDYEYRLDNGLWQGSGSFSDLVPANTGLSSMVVRLFLIPVLNWSSPDWRQMITSSRYRIWNHLNVLLTWIRLPSPNLHH